MATMYEIVGDIKALSSLIDSLTDEETGEVRELTDDEKSTLVGWLNEGSEAFDEKFDRTCKYFRNLQARAEACTAERDSLKDEMDRLSKRSKARLAAAGRIKDLLWFALDSLKKKKHETALFSAEIQNTAASVKTDPSFKVSDVPEFLLKPRELSSSAVAQAVKDGVLYKKRVSTDAKGIESGAFVSPLDADSLFYRKDEIISEGRIESTEIKLPGIRYSAGKTLVIR